MENNKEIALLFKAFCDENRLHIIEALQVGEKCACTLLDEIPIAQSTLSHHMKILIESTIVTSRKDGKWTYYSLSDDGAIAAQKILNTILEKSDDYKTFIMCS